MEIDRDGIRAPYLQLADALRAHDEAGEFRPGRKVPSQTQLEEESGLSRNTAKKALRAQERGPAHHRPREWPLRRRIRQHADNPAQGP
ncbi:GntR family transcriptional regulator [Nonomuraea ferruginea]|uniref:GntR family transcriptional regulator n=1 Tax=Nonomuraea ferruginea TaxID=46174 RepID=UPI0036182A9D